MTKTPTLLEKANYIEQLADEFNKKTNRSLVNLQPRSRKKNMEMFREMVDPNIVNPDKVVELIFKQY